MRTKAKMVFSAAACCTVAGLASAMPTPLTAYTTIDTRYPLSTVLGSLPLIPSTLVPVGTSTTLSPADPLYGAATTITFNVSTVGMTRTVTLTYETAGDPFVTPYAFSQIPTPPAGGYYTIRFGLLFSDPEYTGGTIYRSATLSGDGVSIATVNFQGGFNLAYHRFNDDMSPAAPGFYNAQVIADRYTQTVTYSVIPSPAGVGLMIGAVLPWARRRR